ncbi:MAG: peptidase S1 [Acidobacteria bacterium]|nr:MAG: peptidase S1 [Acidobacteriota bacterium]
MVSRQSITRWAPALCALLLLFGPSLSSQETLHNSDVETLERLSSSVQSVVSKVAPSIVRIEVVGYGRESDDENEDELASHLVARRDSVASGIVIDSNGYIVTNAHVINGARRVHVILGEKVSALGNRKQSNIAGTQFDAVVVGIFEEADLALLKIGVTGLPVLPFADSNSIRAGQLVFAVGNPEGLNNSVSMGVVSAVARQRATDQSPAYIQTDAALNPGSSGGALVDIHGNLIGITSFILTEGGGSEGIGFALPSALVRLICGELRSKGYFDVGDIGLRVQPITATMADGLHLSRSSGLIVSDVIPGSSAEAAGIRVQDILLRLDGNTVDSAAQYATSFYGKRLGDGVELEVLRGFRSFSKEVTVQKSSNDLDDPLDEIEVQKSVLKQLGIVAVALNDKNRNATRGLRSKTGVLVAGRLAHSDFHTGLVVGDLIRSVNGTDVQSVENLRSLLDVHKSGEAIVLQIERHGRLRFLSFEND